MRLASRPAPETDRSASNPLEDWLGRLAEATRLGEDERRAIRAELESHVADRCRDLIIGGVQEPDALHTALGELGDASDLAARLRSAHLVRRRRRLMHLASLGLGVSALGIAFLSIGGEPAPVRVSVFQEPAPGGELASRLDHARNWSIEDQTVGDFARSLEDLVDVPVQVAWAELEIAGVDPASTTIDLRAHGLSVRAAMDRVLEQIEDGGSHLTWHVDDSALELGSFERFLRRSVETVAYDVADVLAELTSRYEMTYDDAVGRLEDAVVSFSHPEHWEVNGGAFARMSTVGGRLFVEAPVAVHRRVAWVLSELATTAEVGGGAGGGPRGPGMIGAGSGGTGGAGGSGSAGR